MQNEKIDLSWLEDILTGGDTLSSIASDAYDRADEQTPPQWEQQSQVADNEVVDAEKALESADTIKEEQPVSSEEKTSEGKENTETSGGWKEEWTSNEKDIPDNISPEEKKDLLSMLNILEEREDKIEESKKEVQEKIEEAQKAVEWNEEAVQKLKELQEENAKKDLEIERYKQENEIFREEYNKLLKENAQLKYAGWTDTAVLDVINDDDALRNYLSYKMKYENDPNDENKQKLAEAAKAIFERDSGISIDDMTSSMKEAWLNAFTNQWWDTSLNTQSNDMGWLWDILV